MEIKWTASTDDFGHSITYSVYYSTDNGDSWITLASGLTALTFTWDITSLYDGTIVLLKVQSTDNVGFSSYSVGKWGEKIQTSITMVIHWKQHWSSVF